MSQDSSKSSHVKNHLIFYIVGVAIVLGLFQLTSAYGEANLKAPPNLNGRYLSAAAPPGCPTDRQFALTIQQSGIYLNGAIELAQAADQAPVPLRPEQFTLIGRWQQQVTLSGSTPALAGCGAPASTVGLQATFQPPAASPAAAALVGQLNLDSAQPWSFTAVRQADPAKQSAH
jgi:hypothetical protein